VKLVFINRYYWPDRSATSQLLTDLATHLAGCGHDVRVVAGDREQDPAAARLPARTRERGVDIRRLRSSAFGRGNLLGRVLDYVIFYLGALWFVLAHVRRGDVVVAKTDPPLLGAVLSPALRLKGATLVNWLQDLYPEVAEQLGVLRPSLFTGLLRRLRNASLRRARMNVVIGERMRERVLALAPGAAVTVIPNWSEPLECPPVPSPDNPYRRQLGLGSKVVFGYSGNLGRAHRFDALLAAGAQLRDRSDIHFLVIGDGPQLASVRAAAQGFPNWSFLPPQPRERLAESLGAIDVHLVSLEPELEGLIVPSKIYGVLAAGRPCIFIGSAEGEVADLLRRGDCGATVAPEDVVGLVQTLQRYATDATLRSNQGKSALDASRAYALRSSAAGWEERVFSARLPLA
jgi:colanic acid biosynthesis glycosyl transferase WcaI